MLKIFVFSLFVAGCIAIPVDNGVEGDPEIECGPSSITINFNTQNNFEGHVYVKVCVVKIYVILLPLESRLFILYSFLVPSH